MVSTMTTNLPMVEEILKKEPYPAPKLLINPDIRDFYQFTVEDIRLENYQSHKLDGKFEMAV